MGLMELATALLTSGGGAGAMAAYLRWRGKREEGKAQAAVAREESATAVVPELREMLTEVMRQQREERAAHEAKVIAMEAQCDQKRVADRARCDEEIAAVRADVGTISTRLRDVIAELHGEDCTGVHHLERISQRSPTPAKPMPAVTRGFRPPSKPGGSDER